MIAARMTHTKEDKMGHRGESWVIMQVALLTLFLVVPRIGAAWPSPDMFRLAGWAFVVTGILLMAWSAHNLGRSLTPFPHPRPQGQLVTNGAYRFVRHPMYFAILIGGLGWALVTFSPLRLVLVPALFHLL
ncbi:methyltransferase family protein [Undibacterium arcticum]